MAGTSARQTAVFSGLRFFLAGFEEPYKNQAVEDVTSNGGQVSERYDLSCSHVVVSSLTYKDPICAAARKDGKALVTEAWVVDCVDNDTLADVNDVSYGPPRDLDGIRGSENLCVCLTGYQGLQRKRIMRMVELTGAKFTKPLNGSVVTHLICYKFEGEKYDLAKKSGLVLVNHYWLEDSLKEWKLLPESDYAKSGWEAETLKSQQIVVEDSPEQDALPTCNRAMGMKSSCKQIRSPPPPQILQQNEEIVTLNDEQNKGSKSSDKSSSHDGISSHFVPPFANEAHEQVASEIGVNIKDVHVNISRLQQMVSVSKTSIEDFPVCVVVGESEKGCTGAMFDVQKDDTTDLYVEEENESDHSCGRTTYQEMNNNDDKIVDEIEVREPVNTTATICDKMELKGFGTEHTFKRRISGAEDLQSPKSSPSGDQEFESPGTKRRRSSELARYGAPLLEKACPSFEEEKDLPKRIVTEDVACFGSASDLHASTVQGPIVKQEVEVFSSSTGSHLSDNKFSQNNRDLVNADEKTSSATEKKSTDKTELNKDLWDVMDDVQGAKSLYVENKEQMEGDGAATLKGLPIEVTEKSVKPSGSPGSTCTEEKDQVLKRNGSANLSRPLSLVQLAQSYNPVRREISNQKKKPAFQDKENLAANETNQKVQPKAVMKKTKFKKTCEVTKAPIVKSSKMCFAVGGTTEERTRLHSVIKSIGGRICRSRHQWREEATHLVLPGPLRRTEKFLAGAAAGRWILKPEYLEESRKAGKFLDEEAYEWYGQGTNDKGSISLRAPRKWRMLQATSGVGAFHGLRVLFYGECIALPLDTLRRAIKAGGGLVLATSPPYTRHLPDGVDFAIISPGIPREDQHVQEFLKHEVACVTSEYFVDLVCHPSSSLNKYILYETAAAVKAAKQHQMDFIQSGKRLPSLPSQIIQRNEEVQETLKTVDKNVPVADDISCSVCGKLDDEEVMLLCGDDKGGGCGAGIHIYCCTPPLHRVPDEDWFCSRCQI